MMRQVIPLALIGLALASGWATALGCWRRMWWAPPPPPACPPRPVLVPMYPPAVGVAPPNYSILPAPTVSAEPGTSEPSHTEPAKPTPAKPEPGRTEAAPSAPKPVAPGIPPGGRSAAAPTAPRENPVRPTEFARPESAAPPKEPAAPVGGAPRIEIPQLPVAGAPGQSDKSHKQADPPKGDEAKIPPLVPRLPDPDVPPLTIPQLPVEPRPAARPSTSKASPLTESPRVDVYPVDGPPPASPQARRKVGFFNHTDRVVRLTVEGETVMLPGRHFVAAEVPAKFAWRINGGEERRTEVPATAPGVEVVIRK
jgi:hypothetical protein